MLTSSYRLSEGDQIWTDAFFVLIGQVFSSSSITRLNLITDEEDVVLVAEILHSLEISFWWEASTVKVKMLTPSCSFGRHEDSPSPTLNSFN